jgi:phenylalanyl-tRNA synthetase beta subunit
MTDIKGATASLNPIAVAKKYRISVEDAKVIIAEHGDDAKAVHKAARRIAA